MDGTEELCKGTPEVRGYRSQSDLEQTVLLERSGLWAGWCARVDGVTSLSSERRSSSSGGFRARFALAHTRYFLRMLPHFWYLAYTITGAGAHVTVFTTHLLDVA